MARRGFCWQLVMASVKFFTKSVKITGSVLWQEGLPSQNDGNWSIFKVASLWRGMDLRGCCQQLTLRCYGTPTRHEGLSLSLLLSLSLSCAFPLLPFSVVLFLFFLFLLCFPSSSFFSHTFPLSLFFCFCCRPFSFNCNKPMSMKPICTEPLNSVSLI